LLEQFIWQMEGNVENQEVITSTHEYVIAYERQPGGARANVVVDPNVDDDSKLLRDFAENSVIKNGPGNPASVIVLPVGFPCAVSRLEARRHPFADAFIKEVEAAEGYITRDMKTAHDVEYPIRLDDMLVEDG
jgi:adenine-specific DNA-methyltransferase